TGLLPRLRGLRWIIAWFLGSSRLLRVLRGLSGVVGDGDRRRDLYPAVHPAQGELHLAGLGSGTQAGLHRRVDDVEQPLGLAVDDQLHLPVAGEPLPGDREV